MYVCVWVCVCMFRKPKTKKFRDFTFYTAKENFLSITKTKKPKKKQHPPIKNTFSFTTNLPAIKPVVTW